VPAWTRYAPQFRDREARFVIRKMMQQAEAPGDIERRVGEGQRGKEISRSSEMPSTRNRRSAIVMWQTLTQWPFREGNRR